MVHESTQPWQSDFVLDADVVRRLLRSQFPALGINSVQYLHAGWDSTAYVANGEWVFKFPKRSDRQDWLTSEVAVLELLRSERLEVDVPIPAHRGQPGPLFPYAFVGYRLIDGTQADCLDATQVDRATSARKLGEFLATLHSIDAHEAAARGVRQHDSPMEVLLAETGTMRGTVFPKLSAELEPLCRPFLDGTAVVPHASNTAPSLIHGDLVDEHILLNESRCVTGIIDWGDACLADPAIDFSGIYAWLGEDFVQKVLEHYALPWDASFFERIRFRGRCLALITYGHSLEGHDTSRANRLPMVYTAFGMAVP